MLINRFLKGCPYCTYPKFARNFAVFGRVFVAFRLFGMRKLT